MSRRLDPRAFERAKALDASRKLARSTALLSFLAFAAFMGAGLGLTFSDGPAGLPVLLIVAAFGFLGVGMAAAGESM